MLFRSLEQDYAALLIKLSAYLRSPDAAAEALHETYVKLRSQPPITDLRQPRAYLYRMAINLALNSRRKDIRTVTKVMSEFEALPDGAPDPERSVARRENQRRDRDHARHPQALRPKGSCPDGTTPSCDARAAEARLKRAPLTAEPDAEASLAETGAKIFFETGRLCAPPSVSLLGIEGPPLAIRRRQMMASAYGWWSMRQCA